MTPRSGTTPEPGQAYCSIMTGVNSVRPSAISLVLLYSAFAACATVLNLLGQELSLAVYAGPFSLYVAILAGTAVGLISKYLLDKKFIFRSGTRSWSHDLNRFVAYSVTGLLTTLIFWGFELFFEWIFATRQARYSGAVIGLSIGYVLKYKLDKRYVFSDRVT